MADTMKRAHPLEGRGFGNAAVTLKPAPSASRISLRAGADAVAALSKALGVELPSRPKTTATKGDRTAIWLGPDEWLVIDAGGRDLAGECAKAKALHSAVDISHRNTAIEVSGPGAAAALNAGCPLDLSDAVFPAGAGTRTLLGKAEIVLWRAGADTWHVECWRSFSPYVFALLEAGARDAAA